MKNIEKYKTAEERAEAFRNFCEKAQVDCAKCPANDGCEYKYSAEGALNWLDLEAEEEQPLPCPCCGADAEIHYEDDVEREGDASVQCKGCFLMTPDYPSDVEAVMAWNKRMSNQERK